MGVCDNRLYEYALIRYLPVAERGEFLNIGLIMMNKRMKWLKGKIYIDKEKLLQFYPLCDVETLKNQCRLFEMNCVPANDLPVEEKYRWLSAVKSAAIQVSPSHPGLLKETMNDMQLKQIEDIMEQEFVRLFNKLVK